MSDCISYVNNEQKYIQFHQSNRQHSNYSGFIYLINFAIYQLLQYQNQECPSGKKQNEPHRDKTNKMACAPSEDSDQPGHPPSQIRVFAVRLKKGSLTTH